MVLVDALDGADLCMNLVSIITPSDDCASSVNGDGPVPKL